MISLTLAKLLVLTARPRLNAVQEAQALALCATDIDWQQFIELAERKQSLPLAYSNLAGLGAGGPPAPFREEMRRRALAMTLAALKMMSAQIQFQKACLEKCGADHVFIKGPAMAAAYYGDIGLRYARDIDILVRETMIPEVVFLALASGYTLGSMGQRTNGCTEADILRAAGQDGVVTLRAPDGVHIEVHRCLGKLGFTYFDSDRILQNKSVIAVSGVSVNIPHIDDLFPYICYHHTGHYWSRLHWLADLDAIIRHPTFNTAQALASARRYRLHETVEACLELNRLSSNVDGWDNDASRTHGKQLLRVCLKNLDCAIGLELEMRRSIYWGWFAFKWQRDVPTAWHIFTQKVRELFSTPGFSHNQPPKKWGGSIATAIRRVTKYIVRATHRKEIT